MELLDDYYIVSHEVVWFDPQVLTDQAKLSDGGVQVIHVYDVQSASIRAFRRLPSNHCGTRTPMNEADGFTGINPDSHPPHGG
jgi:hypothetical protein